MDKSPKRKTIAVSEYAHKRLQAMCRRLCVSSQFDCLNIILEHSADIIRYRKLVELAKLKAISDEPLSLEALKQQVGRLNSEDKKALFEAFNQADRTD